MMYRSEIASVILEFSPFRAERLGRKISILLYPDVEESIFGFEVLGSSTNKDT